MRKILIVACCITSSLGTFHKASPMLRYLGRSICNDIRDNTIGSVAYTHSLIDLADFKFKNRAQIAQRLGFLRAAEKKQLLIDGKDTSGCGVINYAVWNPDPDARKFLVEEIRKSCETTCETKTTFFDLFAKSYDNEGHSPWMYAVSIGATDIVKYFLDQANLSYLPLRTWSLLTVREGVNLWTPLHYAVAYKHVEVVKLLLSAAGRCAKKLVLKRDAGRQNSLQWAYLERGGEKSEQIIRLLEKAVNPYSNKGNCDE